MWAAKQHVVKVGGRGRDDVPEAHGRASTRTRYPSMLPGGALEGPLPPGPDDSRRKRRKPSTIRTNPQPGSRQVRPEEVEAARQEEAE